MEKEENDGSGKPYALDKRTELFARQCRALVKLLPRTIGNVEDAKQLVRASGSVGANYIEANEALSKKDFLVRVKICRKEAKESGYFLRLLDCAEDPMGSERDLLVKEAQELVNIFNAIIRKSEGGQ